MITNRTDVDLLIRLVFHILRSRIVSKPRSLKARSRQLNEDSMVYELLENFCRFHFFKLQFNRQQMLINVLL